jgi:putative isomerase
MNALLASLRNRINLTNIPYTDRGSRLLLLRHDHDLFIRLAERPTVWVTETGDYHKHATVIERLRFGDSEYAIRDIETYPHAVFVTTDAGVFPCTLATPEAMLFGLPAGMHRITFEVRAESVATDAHGGTFTGKHHTAYTTTAAICENCVSPARDGFFYCSVTVQARSGDVLLFSIGRTHMPRRAVQRIGDAIARNESAWADWFGRVPPVQDSLRDQVSYAWWIMRANLLPVENHYTREALSPSKITYVGVWQWDQFFHAIAYRHVDVGLAEDQLRIVLDHQHPSGLLPDAIYDSEVVHFCTEPFECPMTKPPLIAWAALKLYRRSGNREFLREIYEPIQRWQQWWIDHATDTSADKSGLCGYRHPNSSGQDNNPLWQGLWHSPNLIIAPDLNTYLTIQAESLAHIALLLGKTDDAVHYRKQADTWTSAMLRTLWSEPHGMFLAKQDAKPILTLTPNSLLPLWTGQYPEAIVSRLITHLNDPASFATSYPIPTVARCDPDFDPLEMWRGPVWVNINYMFVEALERVGQTELARELRKKTLALMTRHADIPEYYNPLDGSIPPKAAPNFGWSAALFIDMALAETESNLLG